MAAANFSRDVLEMFYGPIDDEQRLPNPISPSIIGDFEIVIISMIGCVYGECESQRTTKTCSNFFKKRKILS